MADPTLYTYPSPLEGYRDLPPLPNDISEDGKSFKNPSTGKLSDSYTKFTAPLKNGKDAAFDVHIYYFQSNDYQVKFATELWERIRREFPELRIYKIWDKPIGPHPIAMFEVNLFTPAQFGAFVPWLVINRGPLSALVHPNTKEIVDGKDVSDEERDHTQRATWMGEPVLLDLSIFKRMKAAARAKAAAEAKA
ncbi:hypothetical protein V499_08095 [Pseudogymnoascus sp. VKM F-103]|uniref:DOPA 4,5-dioxygenase n=1 Tax=Pseudogymnoascus verrucosus TaxID=342668 RepID=A0A1B8GA63_9PEZI|nr:uncharacterized protein VE01_09845 [Pseudogymnoascus verrucosus]KFY71721.1 hypothetical protein V499_08095 [Pseudogymnoascus sp. VKM F-103]OBT92677.1 hypothetical protein VE01_09845 [Pseudogymnoascus verrucosus]